MSKLENSIGQAHTCCGLGAKLKVGRGPAPPGDSDTADTDSRYYTLDSVETRAAAFNDTMTILKCQCARLSAVSTPCPDPNEEFHLLLFAAILYIFEPFDNKLLHRILCIFLIFFLFSVGKH